MHPTSLYCTGLWMGDVPGEECCLARREGQLDLNCIGLQDESRCRLLASFVYPRFLAMIATYGWPSNGNNLCSLITHVSMFCMVTFSSREVRRGWIVVSSNFPFSVVDVYVF